MAGYDLYPLKSHPVINNLFGITSEFYRECNVVLGHLKTYPGIILNDNPNHMLYCSIRSQEMYYMYFFPLDDE